MQIRESDIAWLACAIDGEGNICLYPQTQKGYLTYRPVIQVINTNKEFVARASAICAALGATNFKFYTKRVSGPYKTIYVLQVRGQKAVRTILGQLLDWFIIKREFAADLFKYLARTADRADNHGIRSSWEDEEAERIRAKYMPKSKRAIGEIPAGNSETIPSQAEESANSTSEGVETRVVTSASNNPPQECPGSSPKFPPRRTETNNLEEDRDIVRLLGESLGLGINNQGIRNQRILSDHG